MDQSAKQQTVELIKNSNSIVLITHQDPDGDGLGSILALGLVLKSLDKKVTMVSPGQVPTRYQFLPSIDQVTTKLEGNKDFVIALDTSTTQVEKLGYKNSPDQDKLKIVVTPKSGTFTSEDVSFEWGANQFDLMIVLDSPSTDRLGAIFEQNATLFYETPLINIDHHPSNERFGKVNWVDLTATSTAELLIPLIESLQSAQAKTGTLVNEDVATALLTGLIDDTGSFQNINTTPRSLTQAAQLIALGARQQEIVNHLYKMKPLSTLKLWGRVLTRVERDQQANFAYSVIRAQDWQETGADAQALTSAIDEIFKIADGVEFVALLSERNDRIRVSLRSVNQNRDVFKIANELGGGGHPAAAAFDFALSEDFDETVLEIIEKIRQLS